MRIHQDGDAQPLRDTAAEAQSLRPRIGLVLSGGGARAAYQAGALKALAEIVGAGTPFSVLTGVSAGAINATALAARADDFVSATNELWETWRSLEPGRVYRTDVRSLASIAGHWMRELGGGGLVAGNINHLLDTSPLRDFLAQRISFDAIRQHLERRTLRAVAVSATSYRSGTAITFYDREGEPVPPITPWVRSMRMAKRTTLRLEHVLASAAIPIFFPPVAAEGDTFGDGCIRLGAPLSPAIHLGAEAIVAIGVRYPRSADHTVQLNHPDGPAAPSLSDIGGVLLNAVFLDALDSDIERMQRINRTLALVPPTDLVETPLRPIPVLALRPSRDLGKLAVNQHAHMPRSIRYLLRGIGVTDERGADLLSYLAFSPTYITQLMDLGYHDTLARRRELEELFTATHADLPVLARSPLVDSAG